MIITDPSVRSLAKAVTNAVDIVCQEPEGLEGITVALLVGTAETGAKLGEDGASVGGLVGVEGA